MAKWISFLSLLLFSGASCSMVSAPQKFACGYNGQRYEVGAQFPSTDGCNTCTCGENGQIACTQTACANEILGQTCQTAADCANSGIDTSFCASGAWTCQNAQCEFACEEVAL